MRKLLENEISDEIKKTSFTIWIFSFLTFSLFLMTRFTEKAIFNIGFIIELIFIIGVLRFYSRSLRNRNYALWGFTIVLSIYIGANILQYTFIHYNIAILYIAFLSILFLFINAYIMSSPLYFPRIQWWEYDFRYRGELKGKILNLENTNPVRVADIRRESISFLAFDMIRIGETIELEIPFGQKIFHVKGELKTAREDIPGRPISYGLKLDLTTLEQRTTYSKLRKVWGLKKTANIRRKFSDFQEKEEV